MHALDSTCTAARVECHGSRGSRAPVRNASRRGTWARGSSRPKPNPEPLDPGPHPEPASAGPASSCSRGLAPRGPAPRRPSPPPATSSSLPRSARLGMGVGSGAFGSERRCRDPPLAVRSHPWPVRRGGRACLRSPPLRPGSLAWPADAEGRTGRVAAAAAAPRGTGGMSRRATHSPAGPAQAKALPGGGGSDTEGAVPGASETGQGGGCARRS